MSRNWNRFEGRSAGGWRLESFLGEREEIAFFGAQKEDENHPALVELMIESGETDAVLASWSLARRFQHRHLLAVYNAGVEDIEPGVAAAFAVLELPEDDLSEMVPRRQLEEDEVRKMLLASARALEYLHNHGVVHGAVLPQNIFVARDEFRLGVDSLSAADPERKAADVRQLGSTLVWVLGGGTEPPTHRPSPEAVARLALPFREIAMGCLHTGWTATQTVAALEGRYVPPVSEPETPMEPLPEPVPERGRARAAAAGIGSQRWSLVIIILVAFLLVMAYLLSGRTGRNTTASSAATPAPATPSPQPDTAQPAPAAAPSAPATAAMPSARDNGTADRDLAPGEGTGDWAVVVAAYGNRGQAQERADKIRKRWAHFDAHILPSTRHPGRYLVVLGNALSKENANDLLHHARTAGLSGDCYVAKLTPQ